MRVNRGIKNEKLYKNNWLKILRCKTAAGSGRHAGGCFAEGLLSLDNIFHSVAVAFYDSRFRMMQGAIKKG